MKKYIFSIGLIPVQEFISEARRSRDLKWGSAFLSKATAMALKSISDNLGAEILIPKISNLDKIAHSEIYELFQGAEYSYPNRASGYCLAESETQLKSVFHSLNFVVSEEWNRLRHYYLSSDNIDRIQKEARDALGKIIDGVRTQGAGSDCPIQVVWTALEAEEKVSCDKKQAIKDLEKIDLFYNDIKRFRPIKPWRNGAAVEKCTQCGKREAIGPNGSFGEWRSWQKKLSETNWIKTGYWFNDTERLCGVCVLKRVSSYDNHIDSFPSTNEIACRQWLDSIKKMPEWQNSLLPYYSLIHERFRDLKILDDIPLVFYRRSLEKLKKKLAARSAEQALFEKIEEMQRKLDRLHSPGIGDQLKKYPSNYLALIIFDGDSMGKKVRQFPQLMPELLTRFSEQVPSICDKFLATPFYIGGDEGLILSPIENAFKLAINIRGAFENAFEPSKIKNPPTMSAAVVVFDRERPLGSAIKQAHELLKRAKDALKKDRLAAGVETASGNRLQFVAGWNNVWKWLDQATEALKKKELSASWTSEMESYIAGLPEELFGSPVGKKAVVAEMRRITFRKLNGPYSSREDKMAALEKIFRDFKADKWFEDYWKLKDLAAFASQFHLLGFLARQ